MLENVVGLLQNGYRYDHSISGNAERVGIIHIIGVLIIHKYFIKKGER